MHHDDPSVGEKGRFTLLMYFISPTPPPALARLRYECPQPLEVAYQLFWQMLSDKGIAPHTASFLAASPPDHVLGRLLTLALVSPSSLPAVHTYLPHLAHPWPHPQYQGTRDENRWIDAAIEQSPFRGGVRSTTWHGAAGTFTGGGLQVPAVMRTCPIVIVGAGAAGVFAARALTNAGFGNIALIDSAGRAGGIWQKDMLKKSPMAVPFPLHFEDIRLDAAPQPGETVTQFLERLSSSEADGAEPVAAFPSLIQGEVLHIEPGDLAHRLVFRSDAEGGKERAVVVPLVLNCVGVGDPLPPSRAGWMTTDVTQEHAGIRWQEWWDWEQARRYHHRHLVFVGLSNATLEMVRQVQDYNQRGLQINYTVLSHYPAQALADPLARVAHNGKHYRLYRHLGPERMNLLRVAGDLDHVNLAFVQARETQHILSHITHWTRSGNTLLATDEDGTTHHLACDALYTLIGYGPQASVLTRMGLAVNNPYLGAIDMDYDGEAQRPHRSSDLGRERVFPGYFCLGHRNAYNPNEVLLPGILYRLSHLVAGVILRAAEWAVRQQGHA